jgi:hypothetical protein
MLAISSMPFFDLPPGLGGSTAPVSTQIESGAAAALGSAAAFTGPAAPFVAGAAAIAELLAAFGVGAGCGQACIQATNLVNQAEPVLQQNLQAYENGQIDQPTAEDNYQKIWQSIQTACSAIPGGPGQRCVTDRQQGACTWKATGNPPTPYSPSPGSCWNWYNGYYVPLTYPPINAPAAGSSPAADSNSSPAAASNPASGAPAAAGSLLSSVGIPSSLTVPLLIGGAVLLAWMVIK